MPGATASSTIIKRLGKPRSHHLPKIGVSFQSVQDIQITSQSSRAQYQYTLNGTNSSGGLGLGEQARRVELRQSSVSCVTSHPRRKTADCGSIVNIDRQLAGRLGVSVQNVSDTLYDAFGQRQVSTIYARNQPIPGHSRGRCRAISRIRTSLKNLFVSSNNTDTQVPLSTFVRTAAPDRAAVRSSIPNNFRP